MAALGSTAIWAVSKSKAHSQAQSQVQVQANPTAQATTGPNNNSSTSQSSGNTSAQYVYVGGSAASPSGSKNPMGKVDQPQGNSLPKPPALTEKDVEAEAFSDLKRAIDEYPSRYGSVDLTVHYSHCTHRYKTLQIEAKAALGKIGALGMAAKKSEIASRFTSGILGTGTRYPDRCDHTMVFEK